MDLKRVILAIALSMIVLGVWTYFFQPKYVPKPQATQEQNKTTATTSQTDAQTDAVGLNAEPASPSVELGQDETPAKARALTGRDITVTTPLYTAVFNSDGGILTSFKLHEYKATIKPDSPDVNLISQNAALTRPLELLVGGDPVWQDVAQKSLKLDTSANADGTLTFTGKLGDVTITRILSFNADSYLIDEVVSLRNNSANRLKGTLGFTLNASSLTSEDDKYNITRVATLTQQGLDEENDREDLQQAWFTRDQGVKWGGLNSNYFLLALLPQENSADAEAAIFRARLVDGVFRLVLEVPLGSIEPQSEKTYSCSYFLGPKKQEILEEAPNDLSKAVNLGWFDFIAKPLVLALNIIDTFVGNYGVAIIILTIIIKIILWPLSHKSYKSMNQMKKLQPMMSKIREKYKNDRQKMNEEMMSLYKTYKVNPAGGCVPMLLQIPVFIGLYQALLNSLELRHAPFITHLPFTDMIWLADLSAKDPYYITPIVMGATMFLQQKMTPSPGDPTQAKIMLFMPIFFTFIFLNFPAGLVIYWLANNVLSIAQQWWMLRKS